MKNLQRIGGVAALIEAVTFIFGFIFLVTSLAPIGSGELSPAEMAAFLVDNQGLMYLWNLVIYVVFGVFLVVLALAIHERLRTGAPALTQIATAFGLIWAGLVIAAGMVANVGARDVIELYSQDPSLAASAWLAISSVQNGIGGGNEIVGGLWVLLVSWGALQAAALPKALNYLGVVVGGAGLLSMIPPLGEPAGAVFGLGSIAWFLWLGTALLRGGQPGKIEA